MNKGDVPGRLWKKTQLALLAVTLLESCSAGVAHRMHWGRDFANGKRAPVTSDSAARAAALRYVQRDEHAADRYVLDTVPVVANGKVWLVQLPLSQGSVPGEEIMGINRKTGRIGWLPLK